MKAWIFLFVVLLSFSCQTLRQEKGSISKQVDLIEDIASNPSLDPVTQARLKIALNNIRSSEQAKDKDIMEANKEAKESNQVALEKTEKAGKWDGAVNLTILAGIVLGLLLVGFLYLKGSIPKIPFIS